MAQEFMTVRIDGLRDLNRSLKALEPELAKQVKGVLNDAAQIVVNTARPQVPAVTGRARASIVVRSTARESRVRVGGPSAPYYPWLDFGGRTGRNKSVVRKFERHGRYLFPAAARQRDHITAILDKRLTALIRGAGLDPDHA